MRPGLLREEVVGEAGMVSRAVLRTEVVIDAAGHTDYDMMGYS